MKYNVDIKTNIYFSIINASTQRNKNKELENIFAG